MNIFLITPIFAITTQGHGATPVVYYFAKEWVRMGNNVTVFHLEPTFPRPFYWFAKLFQHKLNTHLGMLVPTEYPEDSEYVVDGIKVYHKKIKKVVPHSRYRYSQIKYALSIIIEQCKKNGVPDVFIGHWDNPQLEILNFLKEKFGKLTCLILHNNEFHYEDIYGKKVKDMFSNIDLLGFRNIFAKKNYISKYGVPEHSFLAYSGVSEVFIKAGENIIKNINVPVRKFVFVGSLIDRKHPTEIITALHEVYPDGDFEMLYIGDGADRAKIEAEYVRLGSKGKLSFTGRIRREDVINYLKENDVFVMISEGEIFGLVYLEAMSLGLIPVGSRNEGIDGIIVNGKNGFLCEAGNVVELAAILKNIKRMSSEQLTTISQEAKATALDYSDYRAAEKYYENILSII